MCGRYAVTMPPEAIRAWFQYVEHPNFPPRFNIAPTQPIAIVCRDDARIAAPERHFRLVRWGLVPGFVKDWNSFPLIINARAEEIITKPSFRAALRRRRCLVMADAWYEWRRSAPRTPGTPFLFRRIDRMPIGFAGLHERWMGPDGSEMETACIVTTFASAAASAVHPRMPVMLDQADFETWLDVDGVTPEAAVRLLKPPPDGLVEFFAVGARVNKVANDDPDVQQRADDADRTIPPPPLGEPQGSLF